MLTKRKKDPQCGPFFKSITMNDWINFPKIDLHRHLEGSLSPSIAKNFLYDRNKKIKLDNLKKDLVISGEENDLMDFISKLGTKYLKSTVLTKEKLSQIMFGVLKEAHNDGVVYLELRITPSSYNRDLNYQEIIDGFNSGITTAEERFGIQAGLIISFKREENEIENEKLKKLAMDFFEKEKIIGFDLCGNETIYPSIRYLDFFKELKDLNLTIHAGETLGYQEIADAIRVGAKRIGHGISAGENDDLINLIKEKDIFLESSITSNIHTKSVNDIKKHPALNWNKLGLRFSLCTDDPVTSGITLSSEYKKFHELREDLDENFFVNMNLRAIKHSFLSKEKKDKLEEKFRGIIKKMKFRV